jgi:hypothetical protein
LPRQFQVDAREHNAFFPDGVHVLPIDRQCRMHDKQLVFTTISAQWNDVGKSF